MLMKYQAPPSPAQWLLQTADAIGGFLWSSTRQLYKTIKHRRDISVLSDQDDRLLADIGITRGDLRHAIRQPLWRDPTEVLKRRAGAAPVGKFFNCS